MASRSLKSLPTEILLEILENLSYFDLKQAIPTLNKRFRRLIHDRSSHGKINARLFRDIPRPRLVYKGGDFILHPMLTDPVFSNTFQHRVTVPDDIIRFQEPIKDFEKKTRDILDSSHSSWTFNNEEVLGLKFVYENAVSPASTELVLEPRILWGRMQVPPHCSHDFIRRTPSTSPNDHAETLVDVSYTIIYLALCTFIKMSARFHADLPLAPEDTDLIEPSPSLTESSFEVRYSVLEVKTFNEVPVLRVEITLYR